MGVRFVKEFRLAPLNVRSEAIPTNFPRGAKVDVYFGSTHLGTLDETGGTLDVSKHHIAPVETRKISARLEIYERTGGYYYTVGNGALLSVSNLGITSAKICEQGPATAFCMFDA